MLIFLFSFLFSTSKAFASDHCKTQFDELGIPHIETPSTENFYYCFGLSHGRDRAWEMDYFRRMGQGRNAEIIGFSQLKNDFMMKLLDLPSIAEKIWIDSSPENKKWLEIYSRGVNEGFKEGKKSKEFLDLNYSPDVWKPQHSLLVLLLQSFDQTRKTFNKDYEEERSKLKWGKKASKLFDIDNMPWENTILKSGEYSKKNPTPQTVVNTITNLNLWSDFPQVFGEESGSNNWVISKDKSKSGNAILANDPHLDLKTPMFWYWISISSPHSKVMGGSVPGVPAIASGTNGKVAWGLTNSYINTADVVLIKDIKLNEIETIRPLIFFKFLFFKIPFFFTTFERLKSGHRVLPLDIESDEKVVLRWTGFNLKADEVFSFFDIHKKNNVTEMDMALARIGLPSWNFVFADNKGDIGFRTVGKVYRHLDKTPFGVPRITLDELSQEKFFSPSEQPHLLKPKRNYVYSANNRHWPSDSKFYGGRGYSHSYRGFRIDELLGGMHDVDSFKNIQCDQQVVDARFFLSKFQKYLNLPEFNNWSMEAQDSSLILPIYRRFFDLLMEKWELDEYGLFRMLDDLNLDHINEMKSILQQAKTQVRGRNWGEIHRLRFPHMSKNKDWVFSPNISGVGDNHSVNPGTSVWDSRSNSYEQTNGASMRMIIEMGETTKIWLSLPGINRNYDRNTKTSPWQSWKNCQYTKLTF